MTETNTLRIAIATADELGLEGQVSAHFGHSPFFTFVQVQPDGQLGQARIVANPMAQAHAPGEVPRFLQSEGVDVVLAGGMGRPAHQMFEQAGIKVASGRLGRVDEVLRAYVSGELRGFVPCKQGGEHRCGGHQ